MSTPKFFMCIKCQAINPPTAPNCLQCGKDQTEEMTFFERRGSAWLVVGILMLIAALIIVIVLINQNSPASGPVYIVGLICGGFGTLFLIRGIMALNRY